MSCFKPQLGLVTELRLVCDLVLLSIDSKPGNKTAAVPWPDPAYFIVCCTVSLSVHCSLLPLGITSLIIIQDKQVHHIANTHIYLKKKYNAIKWSVLLNSSPPRQNGHHFTGNIFKCIFMKEKYSFFITISLKFVPTGSLDNKPALV